MGKFKNIYKYPFGTIVKIKNRDFVYIDNSSLLGYVFYSNGKIYDEEELFELYGIDEDSDVFFFAKNVKDLLEDLIDAVAKYIIILSEDSINKEEIESQKQRLKLYSEILKIIK